MNMTFIPSGCDCGHGAPKADDGGPKNRIAIDEMLRPTHILYAGRVAFPHRGEFVYVRNDAFPSEAERDRRRIGA